MKIKISTNKKYVIVLILTISALLFLSFFIETVYIALRVVLGGLLLLFLPGFVASHVFFKKEIGVIERIALSIILSISLVILTVLFSNRYMGVPIDIFSIVLQVLIICGFFGGVMYVQSLPSAARFAARLPSSIRKYSKLILAVSGISTVSVLLAVDLFYPFLVAHPVQNTTQIVTGTNYSFEELYNSTMRVYDFYPNRNISENLTGVTVPIKSLNVFDGKIAFLGYRISNDRLNSKESFHITYFWKSLEKVDVNYTVFVHFTDIDGKNAFGADYRPYLPMSIWNAGDVVMEEYDIKLPSNMERGIYTIRIGLYDERGTGERLPLIYGQMVDPLNRAIIGLITVI
jgi:hypothetical protein